MDVLIEIRILDMYIKLLRDKLKGVNIEIKMICGVGYSL